jgi:hypothetical protein
VWDCYLDESEDSSFFVLAGFSGSPGEFASLAKDWEEILPLARRDKHGNFHFKMSEMAQTEERRADAQPFFRIIERHKLCAITVTIDRADLREAKRRVVAWKPPNQHANVWGNKVDNPFFYCVMALLSFLNDDPPVPHRDEFLPPGEKLRMIFDQRSEKHIIRAGWEALLRNNPRLKDLISGEPQFEDDQEFLPLQAADFLAWWWRELAHARAGAAPFQFPWEPKHKQRFLNIRPTEDDLATVIKFTLEQEPRLSGFQIIDTKFTVKAE